MENKVVILVPTKGRLDWCIAKLRFYSNFKKSPSILFLDASEKSNYDLLHSISNKKSQSTIHYLHLPNQSIHFSIEEGLKYALGKWDYFVISGDDDFHLPKMLNKAAKFLDLNKDFVAVTGNAIIARLQISTKKITVLTCANYWKPYSIIKNSPLERFSLLVNNYLNLEFSVKRVSVGLNIATNVNKFNGELTFQESGFSEYCTATAIPLLGKIQNFNRLLMVRGDHPARPFSRPRTDSRLEFRLDNPVSFSKFTNFIIEFSEANNINNIASDKIIKLISEAKLNKSSKNITPNISLAYRIYRRILSIKFKTIYCRVFRLIASN